jgi:hypothetical protein
VTITLGAMIRALEHCNQDAFVRFDFCGMVPGKLGSYRGDYSELALGFNGADATDVRVSDLVAHLKKAVGKEFTGWKGGDFLMSLDSPVWVDNPGKYTRTGIVGIREGECCVIIDTWGNT